TRSTPSPLVGEGWGGGWRGDARPFPQTSTPAPNPSPQGGGEPTEFAARAHSPSHERAPGEGDDRFARAFGAGLLFALALFVPPNIAPAAGILLAGAGLGAPAAEQVHPAPGVRAGVSPG